MTRVPKAMRFCRLAALAVLLVVPACGQVKHYGVQSSTPLGSSGPGGPDVLTWHNDLARTGQYLQETVLNHVNVNPATFGRLFTCPVDGQIYTQPLYKAGVFLPGPAVTRNLVFVATQGDSVYAFDADTGAPIWHALFINPAAGVTTVPSADVGNNDISPQIGITATPVIDGATNTLYVVAKTKEVSGLVTNYVHRLHALDLATGAEKLGGPVVIQASVAGTGNGSVAGTLNFDPLIQNARCGLTLLGGVVYIAWTSHGDQGPYHGWVMGYNATTLGQVAVWCATPNGALGQASVWMDGCGLASDGTSLFFLTGNGDFDVTSGSPPNTEYGECAVRLSTSAGLQVADYFAASNYAALNGQDLDLASGGVALLPDQPGPHPHLMIGGGKEGKLYVWNRDNLGGFNAASDQVVQKVDLNALGLVYPTLPPQATGAIGPCGIFSTPAYFNGTIYIKPGAPDPDANVASPLLAFPLAGGTLNAGAFQKTAAQWGWPGGSPSISANGVAEGIVWIVECAPTLPAVLHAFDAANLAIELYSSLNAVNPGDQLENAVKFVPPTIANGKVYVSTQSMLSIFGLK